eukprot:TRINITY_DN2725_c0_g1_i1.p1 TRINITY_DN2725_c0_g1~~TRINITY_DN2725_c0_g1_i1.p1  ORF type:complete len:453 (-),score=119.86 TRINITY_DN2725_c0_g1_i1:216-1541(-)
MACDMENVDLRLPLVQNAELLDKIVLLRVDHNVVKHGKVIDPYRIDATIPTMYNIIARGGRLILMSHAGRPFDKKRLVFKCDEETSVKPIVDYLATKLRVKFIIPDFPTVGDQGIQDIDTSVNFYINQLRQRKISGIYLPNTRWFAGEEARGDKRDRLALQLAGLADVYVNDAFGSWQAHASTYDVTKHMPSYAGLCMQNELAHVKAILSPKRPFVAVVAGSKYDTKIGPLIEIYKVVDYLILGGVIYNTYLCAKYGVSIEGVDASDIELAKGLVELDREAKKLVELPLIVESDLIPQKVEGKHRTIALKDFKPGDHYKYILDIDPASFHDPRVADVISSSQTIFVNAVMGLTPQFSGGTSMLIKAIDNNTSAQKFYGGGDTLQEFKILHPGLFYAAVDNPNYYLFTGGGTVLNVIEAGDPYGLETVKALMANAENLPPTP